MLRWLPVLAWAGLIFLFSSLSEPPGASSSELRSDIAHTTEYFVLAVLLLPALRRTWPSVRRRDMAWIAWSLCLAYAISDEFHQSLVPGRDSSIFDVGFDAAGAALGTFAAVRFRAVRSPGS
ncbi:MAG: VanZ family protein [Dehalococcoidia bacterium]|nr:VanZ family protein [Dehalococcoidia bacterium]